MIGQEVGFFCFLEGIIRANKPQHIVHQCLAFCTNTSGCRLRGLLLRCLNISTAWFLPLSGLVIRVQDFIIKVEMYGLTATDTGTAPRRGQPGIVAPLLLCKLKVADTWVRWSPSVKRSAANCPGGPWKRSRKLATNKAGRCQRRRAAAGQIQQRKPCHSKLPHAKSHQPLVVVVLGGQRSGNTAQLSPHAARC